MDDSEIVLQYDERPSIGSLREAQHENIVKTTADPSEATERALRVGTRWIPNRASVGALEQPLPILRRSIGPRPLLSVNFGLLQAGTQRVKMASILVLL